MHLAQVGRDASPRRPLAAMRHPGRLGEASLPTRVSGIVLFQKPAVWLSLSLLVLSIAVAGCGKKPERQVAAEQLLPAAQVSVQKIESVRQPVLEEAVGTVQPRLQAVIEAKVSGRITRLPVTLSQAVKQGDLLVELATEEIQAKLDQATAAFRQAELEFNRTSNLRKQQAATQAELDAAQARYNVAKAAVAEAEALSAYAKVLAPFDGVVARKLADEGDLAMPGKPLLELEGRTGLRLVADVPTLLAGHVEPEAKLVVRVDTLADPITGTVAEISPAADPASRTVRVKVDLPRASGLRSGQFGRLSVPVGEGTFLYVPPQALVQRGQLEVLFVAAGGEAQMRLVRTGKQTPQGIEILSGLMPGETIVTQGAALLRDGQTLQVQ
ncbi:MAG TPA: efflux RND transporter periplasmic adaptor subunit [Candidatus Acidoferrum sp.]|nr:efflux RND transporter periplasmic adaptor subunit [Candidatus Acidoferrum sp.]